MASCHYGMTSEGITGASPTQIKDDIVTVTREQWDALWLLAVAVSNATVIPESLRLPLVRVEKVFKDA